jgi:hypothetical protein
MRGDQQHGSPHELQLSTSSSLSRFLELRDRSTFSPQVRHCRALQALRLHRLFTAGDIAYQLLQGNTNLDFNTRHHVLIPVTAAGAHSMFHLHVLGLQGILEGQTCIPEGCVELKVQNNRAQPRIQTGNNDRSFFAEP